MDRLVEPPLEVLELALGGVGVDVVGNVRALAGAGLCASTRANLDPVPTAPDPRPPLDVERLTPYGVEVEVPRAGSTNALVADRARQGAPEWLVIVTEHQTSGRGRLDRTWETPDRAALTFSALLRPERTGLEWPWLPLVAASPWSGRCASTAYRPG